MVSPSRGGKRSRVGVHRASREGFDGAMENRRGGRRRRRRENGGLDQDRRGRGRVRILLSVKPWRPARPSTTALTWRSKNKRRHCSTAGISSLLPVLLRRGHSRRMAGQRRRPRRIGSQSFPPTYSCTSFRIATFGQWLLSQFPSRPVVRMAVARFVTKTKSQIGTYVI